MQRAPRWPGRAAGPPAARLPASRGPGPASPRGRRGRPDGAWSRPRRSGGRGAKRGRATCRGRRGARPGCKAQAERGADRARAPASGPPIPSGRARTRSARPASAAHGGEQGGDQERPRRSGPGGSTPKVGQEGERGPERPGVTLELDQLPDGVGAEISTPRVCASTLASPCSTAWTSVGRVGYPSGPVGGVDRQDQADPERRGSGQRFGREESAGGWRRSPLEMRPAETRARRRGRGHSGLLVEATLIERKYAPPAYGRRQATGILKISRERWPCPTGNTTRAAGKAGAAMGQLIRWAIGLLIALVGVGMYMFRTEVNPVTGKRQHVGMSADQEKALGLAGRPADGRADGGGDRPPRRRAGHDGVRGGPADRRAERRQQQPVRRQFPLPPPERPQDHQRLRPARRAGVHHPGAVRSAPERGGAGRRAGP